MADFGQGDEVVSKPTAAPTRSSWGSDDEVVTKPPVVGSRIHNIARTGVESLPAAGAGLYGFGTGMAAAAPVATAVAPLTGPFAPLTAGAIELAGGLGGAFIASGAAQKITDMLHELVAPDDFKQRQIEKAQRPYGTFAAQTLANLAGMSPKTAPEVAGKLLTKPVAQRVASAGLQTGIEAGTQLATEGKVDLAKLGMSAIAGAAMPGFNVAGKKVFEAGEAFGKKVVGAPKETVAPPPPPPNKEPAVTPEQKAGFIKKVSEDVAAEKAAADAKTPLVQTAIRNKDTGEIELLGPKHSEARKAATKDTHEQGFVDENGNFLERKDAWNRAKSAGQIPEGQTPEYPKEGLHSGDLRKAGDDRFKLADVPTEVNGIPIVQGLDKTRADGSRVGATTKRDADGNPVEIGVDVDHLYQQFEDKPWTKPKVEGVYPIAEDAFKTPQEWVDFVIQHEAEHVKTPKVEGQTKAQYENQTNQAALKTLAEKKATAPKEVPTPPVETSPIGERPVVTDRTKTDPRDVKDEQEMYDIAKEIYVKHGEVETVKFYEGYREYQKTWKEPIKETEKVVGINIRNKEANERVIHNEREEMLKSVPDPARREAVAEAVDKGDLSGLSPEETALAKKYEQLVKDIGDRAVEQGVVKGLLEDYVTHILDWAGAPPGAREEFIRSLLGTSSSDPTMRGMSTTSKFGKERKFKTFADLEAFINEANARIAAAGKSDFRLKIKTKDIAEIYKEYALSMEKAIENKKLVDTLKQIRNVAGETLIKEVDKDNPMPIGWEMMDSPQFSGYAVHPDMFPALKFVFDAGPGDLMKALGAISQLTKRLNVIGSFFHAKSLMEVISSSGIPIWSPIKEAIVLPLIEKGVKAVTGKNIQLSAISKAVEQFKNGGLGDNVDTWIRQDGLKLEMPEDVSQGLLTSVGKYADSLIAKFGPKTRALESTMSTVEKYTLGLFDKYTWDYLHTGGKIMVADAYLDKARRQAAEQGKPFDEAASRKEIASFVNDSFGGLNWFEAATSAQTEMGKRMAMAAYNPEGRRNLQLVLFAPDWTISTVRAFTAALPKGLNPTKWHPVEGVKGMMTPTTKADYARLYQFKTALTYLTLVNGINMITADRPIWENKDPTRIEFPDGTSMQAMKHAMEPYHWIMDPDKTLANKLGFLPKAAIIGIGGLEYGSPNAPKLVDRSATNRLLTVAKSAAPFQFQAAAGAPEGEGAKRAILGTMGFPIYGSTPEQRKLANAERELATKEQAWAYRDKEIQAGRESMTMKHKQQGETLRKRRRELDRKTNK